MIIVLMEVLSVLRGFSELTLPAIEEAKRLGASEVDTEHLLLGLLRQGGVAAQVFSRMGINVDDVRAAMESQLTARSTKAAVVMPLLSPRAKQVMESAADEARAMQHGSIGSHHLLFALLREKDLLAARVLERFGLTLGAARMAVNAYLVELTDKPTVYSPQVPANKQTPPPVQAKERRVCLSIKTRHALLRAADKALSANTETIEFEHLLAAVRELQREG